MRKRLNERQLHFFQYLATYRKSGPQNSADEAFQRPITYRAGWWYKQNPIQAVKLI